MKIKSALDTNDQDVLNNGGYYMKLNY